MADKKISALDGATTPLAGTEVLPIVQSGATVKVPTNDLTVRNLRANATTGILQVTGPAAASTRVVTVPDANWTAARTDAAQSFTGDQTLATGNLIIGTSGKGIDFSATPGTGTSESFADYEEGDWTPTDASGAGLTLVSPSGKYTKNGRLVTISGFWGVPTNASGANLTIGGLPFTVGANSTGCQLLDYATAGEMSLVINGTTNLAFYGASGVRRTNVNYSAISIYFSASYIV